MSMAATPVATAIVIAIAIVLLLVIFVVALAYISSTEVPFTVLPRYNYSRATDPLNEDLEALLEM